ncbi:MAG: hypothetical protein M1814_006508 [Vezdaea aestivalis]|nr:MAG: hypothetical protein M1814_006508 [Vezdaea aestivalis]
MESVEEDNDELILSGSTLDALQSFYAERDSRIQQFEELKEQAEKQAQNADTTTLDMNSLFAEDWNASQFWYDSETATKLAQELLANIEEDSRIAIVSAPSVFVAMKNLMCHKVQQKFGMDSSQLRPQVTLLEYDDRFRVFGEFQKYDFNKPFQLPSHLKGQFTRIICDPPFLSADCQTKAAMTVQWLLKDNYKNSPQDGNTAEGNVSLHKFQGHRIVVCTGERMVDIILRLYGKWGLKTTDYQVKHSKGLSNEFRCFANFECEDWSWIEREKTKAESFPI